MGNISKTLRQGMYKDSLYHFFCDAWRVIEPQTPLVHSWYLEYLCGVLEGLLESVVSRQKRQHDYIINIPPATTKSSLITVVFPVWCWIHQPALRFITVSYAETLAITHATKSRDILQSEWFINYFGHMFRMRDDIIKKSEYANNKTGSRVALGAGGTIVGKHADIIICDDPINPRKAASELELKTVNSWWDSTISTRLRDPERSIKVIVMQRLGRQDLTGHCMGKDGQLYYHICLPAETGKAVKPEGLTAMYSDEGLLEPTRLSRPVLDTMRKQIGSMNYAGQYLQQPVAEEGNMVRAEWFKSFTLAQLDAMARNEGEQVVWNFWVDGAYTEKAVNAPSAILAAAHYRNNLYIRAAVRVWMELPELIKHIAAWCEQEGYAAGSKIYIEPKASGISAGQMLKRYTKLNVILGAEPAGDKVSRLKACLPYIESGRVHLLSGGAWLDMYVDELKAFPSTKYKDLTDVTTAAIQAGEKASSGSSMYFGATSI